MADPLRIATFNASLSRDRAGALIEDLSAPDDPQARKVALEQSGHWIALDAHEELLRILRDAAQ